MGQLNGLDLFSGIGGLTLALEPWVRTIAYCEQDRYAQSVLMSRMREGRLPLAPIWDDVGTLSGEYLPSVDIITGGFPCQDISVAGSGRGLEGSRSGLFFEIIRLARELRPRFLFLENVPAITLRGLDRVLLELTSLGYDCRWTIVSAAEMGAPHLRERWFLLAHTPGMRGGESEFVPGHRRDHLGNPDRCRKNLVDSNGAGSQGKELTKKTWAALAEHRHSGVGAWPSWLPKPALRRGDDGLLLRVDRLRGLGNAVVPAQAREAFKRLAGIEGGVA